jgi:hypothetical protein
MHLVYQVYQRRLRGNQPILLFYQDKRLILALYATIGRRPIIGHLWGVSDKVVLTRIDTRSYSESEIISHLNIWCYRTRPDKSHSTFRPRPWRSVGLPRSERWRPALRTPGCDLKRGSFLLHLPDRKHARLNSRFTVSSDEWNVIKTRSSDIWNAITSLTLLFTGHLRSSLVI